jgi:1-acyl-sn-glycerol-3-phosphate acyltransferase
MIRALATLLVAVTFFAAACIPLLILGIVYRAPWSADWCSWVWSRLILRAAGVRLTVEGLEHVSATDHYFFVGNHQSAVDRSILIVALRGRVRFMAKDSLFRIPVFGQVLTLHDYVPVDRSRARKTMKSLDLMIERLQRRPRSLVVFPEGTRSVEGRLLPFRKGAMKICQRAGLGVVPFAISGSAKIHRRGVFRIQPGCVRIRFAEPLTADEVAAMSSGELHDRVRRAVEQKLTEAPTESTGNAEARSSAGAC